MNTKVKQSLISLVPGLGLALSLLGIFITPHLKDSGSWLQVARAAGPRYVAPTPLGNDSGNDCLNSATPCATMQHAVDQADPADEIRVAAGTYTGVFTRVSALFSPLVVTQAVYISKSLSIQGGYTTTNWSSPNPTANPTILDAQGLGRVMNLETPDTSTPISVTVEGFHLTNGNATNQLSGFVILGGSGGGINMIGVTATVCNNYIFNNHGGQAGGGVAIATNAPVTLINNHITTNTVTSTNNSTFGGGVALRIPGVGYSAIFRDNIIQGNRASASGSSQSASGGGLYISAPGTFVTFSNNLIQANEVEGLNGAVGRGGGGSLSFNDLTMINTIATDNRVTGPGFGPGLLIESGDAHLLHTTIARNNGGDGSGINIAAGTATLTNTILASHTVGITAAAGSAASLDSVLWFNNSGGNTAGAGTINLNNEFNGDPVFTADGYHLGPGSAAIDRGVNTEVTTDIDGEPRTTGLPDLGADEAPGASDVSLSLIKAASPNPVQAGQLLTYTLAVSNIGTTEATGLVISDGLDSNVSFASASNGGLHEAGVVTWSVGTISPTQTITRTLWVTVGQVISGTILTNTAWVTSAQGIAASAVITTRVITTPTPTEPETSIIYLPLILKDN